MTNDPDLGAPVDNDEHTSLSHPVHHAEGRDEEDVRPGFPVGPEHNRGLSHDPSRDPGFPVGPEHAEGGETVGKMHPGFPSGPEHDQV